MAAYNVVFSKSVKRDVRGIENIYLARIMEAIRGLANDPFPPGHKRLKGARSGYRIRVGQYRVVYEVDIQAASVTIFHIRHRKEVYR